MAYIPGETSYLLAMPMISRSADEGRALMQRIRVGLTGLACVFLIVMLAAAFLRMTGETPKADTPAQTTANEATPNEPLAQLGVAPGTSLSDSDAAAPATPAPSKAAPTQHR